ncbi:MAG: hypothetical protein IPF82_16895 [Blastocatellia bacterium]|nr:hypothetical protein [Blastocatellia bacterium]
MWPAVQIHAHQRLPASEPLQLWFGQFIHGVLEEAYRRYRDSVVKIAPSPPPWPDDELEDIRSLIKTRLAAGGLSVRNLETEKLGNERATTAVQELGPHLFPLIHRAEVRLTGARLLPVIAISLEFRVADRYEMVGVVDVVTHVELADPAMTSNPLVEALKENLGSSLPPKFEVIVDYKGMRRPPVPTASAAGSLWTQYAWQVQTYGELRRTQPDALDVVAGVLLYVNELHPTRSDLEHLKDEIAKGTTDVPPALGSPDDVAIKNWKKRDKDLPKLSFEYRLARALRVIPITPTSIAQALQAFDDVVLDIETCRGREVHGAPVLQAWTKNSNEEQTCVVCDSRTFCPDYQTKYATKHGETKPRLPGVKVP